MGRRLAKECFYPLPIFCNGEPFPDEHQDEVYYLTAFAVDMGVWNQLGQTQRKAQVMDAFLAEARGSPLQKEALPLLNARLAEYAEAFKREDEPGWPHWVGSAFGSHCGSPRCIIATMTGAEVVTTVVCQVADVFQSSAPDLISEAVSAFDAKWEQTKREAADAEKELRRRLHEKLRRPEEEE